MNVVSLENGKLSSSVAIRDRGLAYGDGVFETIRVVAGNAEFLNEHLLRLQSGCERLAIPLDRLRLQREIQQLLTANTFPLAVLKITVTRGGQQRGYRYMPDAEENRYLLLEEIAEAPFVRMQQGVKLAVCNHRLPDNPALAGIKHLNRLDNVLARAEWSDTHIDEGLMLDSGGRVIEGTMSNLFLVKAQQLITPDLQRCGVAGIMRQIVLENLAPALGLVTSIRQVQLSDLQHCDEAFICNSLIGICPVLALGCMPLSTGTVTTSLQQQLEVVR